MAIAIDACRQLRELCLPVWVGGQSEHVRRLVAAGAALYDLLTSFALFASASFPTNSSGIEYGTVFLAISVATISNGTSARLSSPADTMGQNSMRAARPTYRFVTSAAGFSALSLTPGSLKSGVTRVSSSTRVNGKLRPRKS